jgi:hypothetical protein
MNYADNPISTLAACIAHAQYEGFANIKYERRDYEAVRNASTAQERTDALNATTPAVRRPTTRDFTVYAMYPQLWGSTALGHGGMGGASMSTAYTVVLECADTCEYLVYFGGQLCYKVNRHSDNLTKFKEDIMNQCLASKHKSSVYR